MYYYTYYNSPIIMDQFSKLPIKKHNGSWHIFIKKNKYRPDG